MADCQDMVNKSGAETSVIFACNYLYVRQRLFYSLGLSLLSTKLNIDMCVKSLLFRLKVMASSVEGSIA
jgi:hypothetical protein